MQLKNLSFKVQIHLSIFILVVLTLVFGFSYNIISSYGYKKDSFVSETQLEAELIANNTIAPLIFLDKEGLDKSFEQLKKYKSILQVQVYLEDGSLFGRYSHANHYEKIKGNSDKKKESWFSKNGKKSQESLFAHSYIVKEPLILNEHYYGVLYLERDVNSLTVFLKEAIRDMILFSFVLLILMGLLIYKVSNQLISPIVELSQTMEDLSRREEYARKLEYNSTNEIGKLYNSFNVLLESIHSHEEQLKKFNLELEDRVQDRTKELVESLNTLKNAQTQLVNLKKWHLLEHW